MIANENFIIGSDVWFRNGADVAILEGYIGAEAGMPGIATMTGGGTRVAIAKDLRVGHKSAGTLVIEDGAEVDVNGTVYAHAAGRRVVCG